MEKMKLPKSPFSREEFLKEEEKAADSLKNNEDVYRFIKEHSLTKGQVRLYLAPLMDLKEDRDYCLHCPGLGACAKTNPGFVLSLDFEDGAIDRHYDPCPRTLEEDKFQRRFLKRDFPREWLHYDLQSIDKTKKRNDAILEMVKIIQGKSRRWLYLVGGKKSGKSMMLASFANTFAELKASPVAFVSSIYFFDEMKSLAFSDKEEFERTFSKYLNCPLLILDGFGNEFISDYNFANYLFPLLLERSKNDLVTCFSSLLDEQEVCQLYADKIGASRAKQLYSILKDYCGYELDVSGADLY